MCYWGLVHIWQFAAASGSVLLLGCWLVEQEAGEKEQEPMAGRKLRLAAAAAPLIRALNAVCSFSLNCHRLATFPPSLLKGEDVGLGLNAP